MEMECFSSETGKMAPENSNGISINRRKEPTSLAVRGWAFKEERPLRDALPLRCSDVKSHPCEAS